MCAGCASGPATDVRRTHYTKCVTHFTNMRAFHFGNVDGVNMRGTNMTDINKTEIAIVQAMGVAAASSASYTASAAGVRSMYSRVSRGIGNYRGAVVQGCSSAKLTVDPESACDADVDRKVSSTGAKPRTWDRSQS